MVDESSGRAAPRVIHMGVVDEPTFSLKGPQDYAEPVWLIVTADLTGDGPSEGDMVGGVESALSFGSEDLSVDITLSSDAGFLEQLPWYSKDAAGPPPEAPAGSPGGPDGAEDGAQ